MKFILENMNAINEAIRKCANGKQSFDYFKILICLLRVENAIKDKTNLKSHKGFCFTLDNETSPAHSCEHTSQVIGLFARSADDWYMISMARMQKDPTNPNIIHFEIGDEMQEILEKSEKITHTVIRVDVD
jgi:hypothetical protein